MFPVNVYSGTKKEFLQYGCVNGPGELQFRLTICNIGDPAEKYNVPKSKCVAGGYGSSPSRCPGFQRHVRPAA